MDDVTYQRAPIREVMAYMAEAFRHDAGIAERLGAVRLRRAQVAAAQRLVEIIGRRSGALLAEPVGTGKTYTALAVARSYHNILIAAPAALRDMWAASLERAGVRAELTTHEALSRGVRVTSAPDFIIVDEAHRLRHRTTARYAALADIARRAHVLLVSATPLQNRREDLAAQIGLFAGREAWSMRHEELATYVVRGTAPDEADDLPAVSGPHRLALASPDDCLDEILALPPPVPPRGESTALALLAYSLIHQWSSSRAALVAALRRRRTRGLALLAALEAGRHPTRDELSAWTHLGDSMQLAFPELVAAPTPSSRDQVGSDVAFDLHALGVAVDRHNTGVEALLVRCRASPDPDDERASLLRRLMQTHAGERIIAFCQYTETVNALHRRLHDVPRIAALTADGGRIASGRISRDAILRQFAPTSRDTARSAERIELLLTTDLLSEGLDLQRASVIVHLDLPWNPARLDQRVGRARRLGSVHDVVTVYSLAPPASAERLLRVEQRLRDKLRLAGRTVGVSGHIIPAFDGDSSDTRALVELRGAVDARLRAWRSTTASRSRREAAPPLVATVVAEREGFLALVHDAHGAQLVADVGEGLETLDDSPAAVLAAIDLVTGSSRDGGLDPRVAAQSVELSIERLEHWLLARHSDAIVDLARAATTRPRRATVLRVAQILARAPRHRRAELSALADAARRVATTPLAEGAERELDALSRSAMADEPWLRSIASFGERNVRPSRSAESRAQQPHILALVTFRPSDGSR